MHRFFVNEGSLVGKRVSLINKQAHQIFNVLRMRPGDVITVLDNSGFEYMVNLIKIGRQEVIGEVISKQQSQAEPRTQITLYQSLLAREKFEWVLQKCTEVGVTSFVPVVTERSIVRRQDAITPRKLSRWRDIITEAAEQSGRGRIPQLDAPVNFVDAVSMLEDFDCCLIGSPQAGKGLREILLAGDFKKDSNRQIALFVGPEGGFTDDEVADACGKGATAFSLGKRILRTETAAVVAASLILHELGELAP
jgi:16S rRNA (uracil1498-N3)-methyltransferase